ncbi:hypothetical protein LTS10_006119 [Elasticomyces elasticus]|nr:hypothetical protein LTS10_006119 [Elasticomyces elasticus]
MVRSGTKISKACEPCRRRKIRCDGQQPCELCRLQPAQCVFRAKARDRAKNNAAPTTDNESPRTEPQPRLTPAVSTVHTPPGDHEPAHPDVYHGITATHTQIPGSGECAQLFYGPSSTFAFLQHLHQRILHYGSGRQLGMQQENEGGEGLDMFVQRSIFFGTLSKRRAAVQQPSESSQVPEVISTAQASVFLAGFKTVNLHMLPLFTVAELDQMLHDLNLDESQTATAPPSQHKALILAVLAIGALSTDATDLAETLYEQAKVTASAFDEAVTVSMIQFSILLADYQVNMGRPNSAYLHLGNATRKAFAMGLNREPTLTTASSDEGRQKRRSTIWCLYFHERWHSLAMGRNSSLKMSDITCRLPAAQPVLTILCEIARIAEVNAEDMYHRRSESLQLLYVAAERTHAQLRHAAEQAGIGASIASNRGKQQHSEVAELHLQTVYYHAVLLNFRPFLVAEALSERHQRHGVMWLREAYRHATDAAQDALVFISNQFNAAEACKVRLNTNCQATSHCAVLLYDILWHPAKYAYNLEYIDIGLRCLEDMANGEPILNARTSIRTIVQAVEQAISSSSSNSQSTDNNASLLPRNQQALSAAFGRGLDSNHHTSTYSNSQQQLNARHQALVFNNNNELPSSAAAPMTDNAAYLGDQQAHQSGGFQQQNYYDDSNAAMADDPMSYLGFDVFTTDLSNFFPMMTDGGSNEGLPFL